MVCQVECDLPLNSVTNHGLTMKYLRRCEHETLRFALPTRKSWRHRKSLQLIMVIYGYAVKITPKAMSGAGPNLFGARPVVGLMLLFTSSTKKQASAQSWRRK